MTTDETSPDADDARAWGTPEGRHIIDLLWNPPPPPARGPKQRLTLDRVVEAAMTLATAEGVEALSMRKVAATLGVGAMSLYTYVPGREELFELMIDRAWADRELPDRDRPWREQVEFHASQAWEVYARHPWLVRSNLWRMPLGPHVLDTQEDLYRAVALSGMEPGYVVQVTGLVEAHVFGAARSAITDASVSSRTGVSTDEYWDSRSSFWGTYYSPERFPTMTRLWEAGAFDEGTAGTREHMLAGLDLLLDGAERHLERS